MGNKIKIPVSKLKFEPVKSSQIKAVAYDQDSEVLYLKFNKGDVYSYWPVEKEQVAEFKASASIGSYFHNNFKMNKELVIQKETIK